MATNFIRDGYKVSIATATGMESGDPFVQGDNKPCVLLIDADSDSPYNAVCQFGGWFDLSVKGIDDDGNSAVAVGDNIFWTPTDSPPLSKKSSGKLYGVAQEIVLTSATSTIAVALNSAYVPNGGITADMYADDSVKQTKLDRDFMLEEFESNPICTKNDGADCAGATGETDLMWTGQNMFEYFILGAGQTLLVPTLAADGLLASLDLTNNEGAEYTNGILARSPMAFTVGTDAFYLKVGLKIADVTGSDICAVGFRKAAQAYNATFINYTDKATINKIAGAIYTSTALNNAGDTDTDTTETWEDGASHVLEVYVSAAGLVTYKVDGTEPGTVVAFTLDTPDVMVPFFHFLHDATTPGAIHIYSWECGKQ